jgi:para-aminobenzoate synthetase component I
MSASFKITIAEKYPWGIINSCGTDYIINRQALGSHYAIFFDFSEAFYPDRHDTEGSMQKLFGGNSASNLSYSGWVGFWTYDFLAAHMGIICQATREIDMPDGAFFRPQSIIYFYENETVIESIIPGRAEELSKLPKQFQLQPSRDSKNVFKCNLDFNAYETVFNKAREEIFRGNTYQIKISQRYTKEVQADPLSVFLSLMNSNPSPESFMIKLKDFSMASCSPETVIERRGNKILTRPIGGTWERKSGLSEEGMISRFLESDKEVSEHNMLVDLERNDMSRICKMGSVRIKKFREIEAYAHLFHLVTAIEGELRDDVSGSDIIKAMLPGGSIAGCPKFKTMELIDKFEPVAREFYTGSFGLIADNGDMNLNLIIRTMLIHKGICHVQAGGGIIVDSDAKYEHNENFIKAKALLESI